MKELCIKVNKMVCGGCENRIVNALSEIEGVKNVEANHKNGIVKVTVNEDIKKELLEEIIDDIGFEVVKED